MVWNAGGVSYYSNEALDGLLEEEADIIGIVEAGRLGDLIEQQALPTSADAYNALYLGGNIAVLARGDIQAPFFDWTGDRDRLAACTVVLSNQAIRVALVDFESNPFHWRGDAFTHLKSDLLDLDPPPDIVMGDFNTPPGSAWFNALREHHNLAFEEAGSGFLCTWPNPVPILGLDHIWLRKPGEVGSCRILTQPTSDHRPVMADIAFP